MKFSTISTILFLFISLASSQTLFAQETEEPADSTEKNLNITLPGEHEKGRLYTSWLSLYGGLNGYSNKGKLNLPEEVDAYELNYLGSQEWTLNMLTQRIDLHKNKVNIEYGMDFVFNTYRFTNSIDLKDMQLTGLDYKKNKLRTTSISVPLMATFMSKKGEKGNRFRFSAGAYGQIMLGAVQKQKVKGENKVKTRDDFNLNKFNYGLTARIGVGPITLYGKYSLVDLFQEGRGPALTPFSFGIVIIGDEG